MTFRARETPVSKLRVNAFTVSADGFGAGLEPGGHGADAGRHWYSQ
jgi:hypothetical protein